LDVLDCTGAQALELRHGGRIEGHKLLTADGRHQWGQLNAHDA
jgi:hypothetical protein